MIFMSGVTSVRTVGGKSRVSWAAGVPPRASRGRLGEGRPVDQRAEVGGGIGSHADLQVRGAADEGLDEGGIDVLVHEDAVRGQAILAGGLKLGVDRGPRRRLDIGVGKDQEGRMPAQLQGDALQGRRALGRDQPADPR
jgi:hypothetical protein